MPLKILLEDRLEGLRAWQRARLTPGLVRRSDRPFALALVLSLALPGTAFAQAETCQDPQSQSEMNRCAYEDWQQADRQLNAAYQRAIAAQPARRSRLQQAQQTWIVFRDRDCESYASQAEGGSMQPLLHYGCMAHETKARTQALAAYARGQVPPAPSGSFAAADRALNQTYQTVRQQTGENAGQLRRAQEAWIGFRDRACAVEGAIVGSQTRSQATAIACQTRLSQERTQTLQERYGDR